MHDFTIGLQWNGRLNYVEHQLKPCRVCRFFSDEDMEMFFKIVDEPFHIRLICEITSLEWTKMMEILLMLSRIDQPITKGSGQLALFLHFNISK